ncbi:hypothetical protein ACSBR1_014536 [Camellia fascicularis]
MGIGGTIPPHIGNLSFLSYFNITTNTFHGHLPGELGRLHHLNVVDFGVNNFGGDVPPWFGNLPKLQYLHLRKNSITGSVPASISNISTLETLDLMFNFLEGRVPEEIGCLPKLKWLRMRFNHFSRSIPPTIFKISSLELIDFTYNMMFGNLPKDLCVFLPKLEILALSGNEFDGQIPSTLGECRELQIISLSYNKFTSFIPKAIGNLTLLQILYLGGNNFKVALLREPLHTLPLQFLRQPYTAAMEPDVSVETSCMVRITVLLIGPIPPSHFRDYALMLACHHKIELSMISSFYTEHWKSPFSNQPCDSGSIRFKFMVGGSAVSPWEDFQSNRKILAVIGIFHCLDLESVINAVEKLNALGIPVIGVLENIGYDSTLIGSSDFYKLISSNPNWVLRPVIHHCPSLRATSHSTTSISPATVRGGDGARRERRNQLHDPNRGPPDRTNPSLPLPRLRLDARSPPQDRALHDQFLLHRAPEEHLLEPILGLRQHSVQVHGRWIGSESLGGLLVQSEDLSCYQYFSLSRSRICHRCC